MPFLTAQQALIKLTDNPALYDTPEKLMGLIKELSIERAGGIPHGSVTVLYSNSATQGGLSNQKIVLEMVHDGANVRVIDTTEAALFMNDDVFKQAAVRAHNMHTLADIDTRGTPLNDFFYHAKDGVWAEVSGRFASATVGEVRVLGGYGEFERTFAQVELPALLAENSKVTKIDGLDLAHLRSIDGERARFDAVKANAMLQMHFSDVSISNYSDYLKLTPDEVPKLNAAMATIGQLREQVGGLQSIASAVGKERDDLRSEVQSLRAQFDAAGRQAAADSAMASHLREQLERQTQTAGRKERPVDRARSVDRSARSSLK